MFLNRGTSLHAAGEAAENPKQLLSCYPPRYAVSLFDTQFFLSRVMQNAAIRFFVAYVRQPRRRGYRVDARIFYKDISLVWRVASHLIATEDEFWIGKGAVRTTVESGEEVSHSDEATTNLPLEIQAAIESFGRREKRIPEDAEALYLILRRAPAGRIAPYADFSAPRQRAAKERGHLIHDDRSIARFTRKNDPSSLQFVSGYAPEFGALLEHSTLKSRIYGGRIHRYRFLSQNSKIQYLFFAGPKHVWLAPPQALTTELSSYGVRTVDVRADEDLFVPAYEYHYLDESGERVTQIPAGFAGAACKYDPDRADASRWLDQLPVIKAFRRIQRELPRQPTVPRAEQPQATIHDVPRIRAF